jgi:hypothetical protein
MSGQLADSPCKVLLQILVDLGVGTDVPGQDWTVKAGIEPDDPTNCLTTYDDAGIIDGRTQPDGEFVEQHGIQVRVRSNDKPTGYAKASSIFNNSALLVYHAVTHVRQNDGTFNTYHVVRVQWTGNVIAVGKEKTSQRFIHTINGNIRLRQY